MVQCGGTCIRILRFGAGVSLKLPRVKMLGGASCDGWHRAWDSQHFGLYYFA